MKNLGDYLLVIFGFYNKDKMRTIYLFIFYLLFDFQKYLICKIHYDEILLILEGIGMIKEEKNKMQMSITI